MMLIKTAPVVESVTFRGETRAERLEELSDLAYYRPPVWTDADVPRLILAFKDGRPEVELQGQAAVDLALSLGVHDPVPPHRETKGEGR